MFKNGVLRHFLGFSGACHGLVLAKPRLLCPEIVQKRCCIISCVSCRGMVFALRGMPRLCMKDFRQNVFLVLFDVVSIWGWF